MNVSFIFESYPHDSLSKELFLLFSRELPLLIFYAVVLAGYSIFVFHFYKQLAQREVFVFDVSKYGSIRKYAVLRELFDFVIFILNYAIIFPLFSFFWFAMMSLLLLVLVKNQPVSTVLLIGISFVSATRILAYYNESISNEIAKLIPFTLLGVFLMEPSFFSFSVIGERLVEVLGQGNLIFVYLIFIVMLEMALKLGFEMREFFFTD